MIEFFPLAVSALILGLLGGGHCLGMCGGLMSALTMAIPAEAKKRRGLILLCYNLGRIASYSLAGLLIGGLGVVAQQGVGANLLRTLAGLLLIAMGFYLAGWWNVLTRVEALGQGLWRRLQPLTKRFIPVRNARQAIVLGALWGWLPCGLVYSTLLWAASQGNAVQSMLLMACFGLGTLPVLLLTAVAAQKITAILRQHQVRIAGALLVIAFGLWTLPGPHQHWLMGH